MRRDEKIKRGRKLCRKYGVRLYLLTKKKEIGYATPWNSNITVNTYLGYERFLSVICHEIAHCLNYRNKKYYKYHDQFARYAADWKKYCKKMSLRAEIYTEGVAQKLHRKEGFKWIYHFGYKFNDESREFLNKHYNW